MKHLIALSLLANVFFGACTNPKQPPPSQSDSLAHADSAAGISKNSFFPVAEFLEAEILRTDSSLLALKKRTTRNGHTDSAFISIPEFNTLAIQFVPRELADSSFEKNYTETAFQDKTTRSITFTYAPVDASAGLQRVDVLTVAGQKAQQVKSIYLEKTRNAGDSVILQKLYWKAQKSFTIATVIHVKGKPAGEEQVQVVWDDSPEEQD